MEVLIAGAGIGGLCCAIALQRQGHKVRVFERSPEVREVGAGLSLWPNATRTLDRIGLGELVEQLRAPASMGAVHKPDGTVLSRGASREIDEHFGAPTIIAHRGELQAGLLRALGADRVTCAKEATDFEQDDGRVTLRFHDGSETHGDLLVGADGVHSAIRAKLGHPCTPRFAGYYAWRGVMSLADTDLDPTGDFWGIYLGRGCQIGITRLCGDRVYWFAALNMPQGSKSPAGQRQAELLERFHGWAPAVKKIFAATPEAAILFNEIADLPPLDAWGRGRVTLLGDAAHATTPNLGQGACMAIEDAAALADSLSPAVDVEAQLKEYEAQRIPRVNRVVRDSRRIGRVLQLENRILVWLRDRAIAGSSIRGQIERMDWLFRG